MNLKAGLKVMMVLIQGILMLKNLQKKAYIAGFESAIKSAAEVAYSHKEMTIERIPFLICQSSKQIKPE